MDTYPPNPKKKVIFGIFVIVCFLLGILVWLLFKEDSDDVPDRRSDRGLTTEEVRAILLENDSQLSAADIAAIVAAGNSGSNGMTSEELVGILAENNASTLQQILQIIQESKGNPGEENPNVQVPVDENTYTDTDKAFCQKMIDEKEVIPIGVDGKDPSTGTMTTAEKRDWSNKTCNNMYRDNAITYPPVATPDDGPDDGGGNTGGTTNYCVPISLIRDELKKVDIGKDTLKDYQKIRTSTGQEQTYFGSRKRVRENLQGKLKEIEELLDLDDDSYFENLDDLCAGLYNDIETLIIEFNEIFNLEIADTNGIREEDGFTYNYRDINFEDIGWLLFGGVNEKGDLEEVLNDSESFKNYEPYHNGNSRSSRKVPKPYDEHFVNFRSY